MEQHDQTALLLGRLVERSELTLRWMQHIDRRLADGDTAMRSLHETSTSFDRRLHETSTSLDRRLQALEQKKESGGAPSAGTALVREITAFAKAVAPLKEWALFCLVSGLWLAGFFTVEDVRDALHYVFKGH